MLSVEEPGLKSNKRNNDLFGQNIAILFVMFVPLFPVYIVNLETELDKFSVNLNQISWSELTSFVESLDVFCHFILHFTNI